MNDWLALGLGGLLLALNAFFVGAEFALISARRSAIEPKAQEGSRRAKVTLRAMEQISLMLAGAQLGITICSLLLLAVVEPAVAHLLEGPFGALGISDALLHPIAFAIALAAVGVSHVVLGEMVPKNIALAKPDRAALVLAPALLLIVRLLRPAIAALNAIANGLLRAAGVQPQDEVTSSFTREEVAGFVDESRREGLLHPSEERTLIGALQFGERTATSVLLPLDDIESLPINVTPHEVERRRPHRVLTFPRPRRVRRPDRLPAPQGRSGDQGRPSQPPDRAALGAATARDPRHRPPARGARHDAGLGRAPRPSGRRRSRADRNRRIGGCSRGARWRDPRRDTTRCLATLLVQRYGPRSEVRRPSLRSRRRASRGQQRPQNLNDDDAAVCSSR